jgi:deoxyribose-phosphate aldolase
MKLTSKEIAQMLDLSCVQADSTLDEIRSAAEKAIKYKCICVFALPSHTPYLIELLKDYPDILVGGTVGFPDGAASTEGKVFETKELVEMGVNEVDMVINLGWLKAGEYDKFEKDITSVIKAANGLPVKTILECHYLSKEEIVKACKIAASCGATFVKTGTGWTPNGATLENIKLMSEAVEGKCKVKAAGGIRDIETLEAMYKLGATRFGVGIRSATSILEDAIAREK